MAEAGRLVASGQLQRQLLG